jgi:hypothetical protein
MLSRRTASYEAKPAAYYPTIREDKLRKECFMNPLLEFEETMRKSIADGTYKDGRVSCPNCNSKNIEMIYINAGIMKCYDCGYDWLGKK